MLNSPFAERKSEEVSKYPSMEIDHVSKSALLFPNPTKVLRYFRAKFSIRKAVRKIKPHESVHQNVSRKVLEPVHERRCRRQQPGRGRGHGRRTNLPDDCLVIVSSDGGVRGWHYIPETIRTLSTAA